MKTNLLNLISEHPSAGGGGAENQPISCKFIVIEHAGVLNLVIGRASNYRYHAALVDRFCAVNRLPSGWVRKPDLVEVYDNTAVIRGGGLAELNVSEKTCVIHGQSAVYGGFEPADIRQFIGNHALFNTCDVTFK